MSATEASEMLARVTSGAAPIDVCTSAGRASLRGAVRAYGAEMSANGVVWPAIPHVNSDIEIIAPMDVSVVIAFAAGFVELSDFSAPSQRALAQLSLVHWPHVQEMRAAADAACAEVVELQQAAARFVIENDRYRSLQQRDGRAHGRLNQQRRLVDHAQTRMEQAAAAVQARVEAASS